MTTIVIWLAIAALATVCWARIGRARKKSGRPQPPYRGTPEENAGAMRDARDKLAANLPVDTEQLADPAAPTSHCPCEGWHFPTSDNCRWCKCHRTAQHPADLRPERTPMTGRAMNHRANAEGSIRAAADTLAEIQGQRVPADVAIANASRAQAIATTAVAQAVLALVDALERIATRTTTEETR